ncbi:unnamed protein product [Protopolystoma xenopodis]|uniref:Aminotransferase class V domain-containing protein n=1 Tax=Protopolystoma xenopodis TaxID=117903 RepID=A0A448WY44_9PLAT|nr:unnamed protein product [Protopolystoma xenopodis]
MSAYQSPPSRNSSSGHRIFYSLPDKPELNDSNALTYRPSFTLGTPSETSAHGQKESNHPFNLFIVYCDYTASGRSLSFIEDFIYNEVLPEYGNTHTTTSVTALQTTLFRHEAKDIIRNAVRANDHDAVIFVGSGSTGAIHKLVHNLNLETPPATSKEAELEGRPLVVCMAAASNITGIMVDVNEISILVHRYGGLIFWDYATAAPYVDIDMNPVVVGLVNIVFIFAFMPNATLLDIILRFISNCSYIMKL